MTDCDYLIVGAGEAGLSFADTLLQCSDAQIVIVDQNRQAGGRWTQTYEFSQAEQPIETLGINSWPFHEWRRSDRGTHTVRHGAPRRDELLNYFRAIIRNHFGPTGRMTFAPSSLYLGDGQVQSLTSGAVHNITVRRKVVYAAKSLGRGSGQHIPCFSREASVELVSPYELSSICARAKRRYARYCVIGSGRTAMESIRKLLDSNTTADQIWWIKPREPWLLREPALRFDPAHPDPHLEQRYQILAAVAHANTLTDLFQHLESIGFLSRIDPRVAPRMFHSGVVSDTHAEQLRTIRNVVRKGHVHAISDMGVVLDHGAVPMPPRTLYIDATSSMVHPQTSTEIFEEDQINVQDVCLAQPGFGGAVIGAIELLKRSPAEKNSICAPLPRPDSDEDLAHSLLRSFVNHYAWLREPDLRDWMKSAQIDGFSSYAARAWSSGKDRPERLTAMREPLPRALVNLQTLIEQDYSAAPFQF